jgi:hypothetical protein
MARLLKSLKATGTIQEKVKAYNDANREVAILCNHKRTVAASHGASIDKMNERVRTISSGTFGPANVIRLMVFAIKSGEPR